MYKDLLRIVEPHTYGISNKGKETLSGFQVGGESDSIHIPGWGQFIIEGISSLEILEETFEPRYSEGYRSGPTNKIFSQIYCDV